MDESQRDMERGQTIEQLKFINSRLDKMDGRFDSIDGKINMLCVDSSKRQKECWDELHRTLVTQKEFAPVARFVYAMVGVVCLAVISGLLALVVRAS